MTRRLTYVTQWYRPEPVNAPEWTARGLQAAGWQVRVLTGIPNYPDGVVKPGYSALRPMREVINGVPVHRTPLFPSHDHSSVGRILNYVSWALSAGFFGLGDVLGASVSYVYSSPATAAWPAMVGRLFGRPYVLCVQDVWPDSVFASGFLTKGFVRRAAEGGLNFFVNLTYKMARSVVVISPGMRDLLAGRGVSDDKLALVYNWVDEDVFRPVGRTRELKASLGLTPNDFAVVYAGNIGAAQGLRTFVDAIAAVADPRVHGVLIGDGVEKAELLQHAEAVAPGRVHFVPPVPAEEVVGLISGGDVQLACLVDNPLFAVTMPSKVQSTLACALPLIVSVPGDAARIVTQAGAGFAARAGDPADLAATIVAARDAGPEALVAMGNAGRELYLREMSAEVSITKLDALLRGREATPSTREAQR